MTSCGHHGHPALTLAIIIQKYLEVIEISE